MELSRSLQPHAVVICTLPPTVSKLNLSAFFGKLLVFWYLDGLLFLAR